MTIVRRACVAGLLSFGVSTGVLAQGAVFDGDNLRATCLAGNCVSAVQATLVQVQAAGMSETDVNSQLGVIAAVLFDAALVASEQSVEQIARALVLLAQFSTDELQQQSILRVANAVLEGNSELFRLDQPFAVSPN